MKRVLIFLILCPIIALPDAARAGGFSIYEMGTRATALGGAFTATADDPSALFYNPAGIAWQDRGLAISYNGAFIMPRSRMAVARGLTRERFPGDTEAETKTSVFYPTGAYLTYRHNARWSGGLGFFTPFGLGVEWEDPDTFAGRPLSTNAQIEGYYLSPVITYRPVPGLALAVGANFVISSISLERIQTQTFGTTTYNVIDVKLEGTSSLGISPAAGLLFRPNDKLSFGINYKGGLTNSFEDQDGMFTQRETGVADLDAAVDAQLDDLGREQKISGDLNYPSFVAIGVRARACTKLVLMADFVWAQWSVFERVPLHFTNPALNTVLEERYEDGQQWRLGVEYAVSPSLKAMAGFVADFSPQPIGSVSPILPDADRLDYSVGLSYATANFEINAAYMLVDFEDRATIRDGVGRNFDGFDGKYATTAHIPSVGITYHFSSRDRLSRSVD